MCVCVVCVCGVCVCVCVCVCVFQKTKYTLRHQLTPHHSSQNGTTAKRKRSERTVECSRTCPWWSLCTSYLLACQVRVTVGDAGLCDVFRALISSLGVFGSLSFAIWRVYFLAVSFKQWVRFGETALHAR